ncbi:MAG: hypothetical protein JWN66_4110 [Sphingomonas bacterium]|uniref:hypothetical protein n=1 Tax=Sphingomonas bacterium TaxID=1895847 RepID=UPI002606C181|nr:hypothetical protein [Sphingomonas bacterium]MDB5706994.1 hypothetical protein [Sphingomonas bacterium]
MMTVPWALLIAGPAIAGDTKEESVIISAVAQPGRELILENYQVLSGSLPENRNHCVSAFMTKNVRSYDREHHIRGKRVLVSGTKINYGDFAINDPAGSALSTQNACGGENMLSVTGIRIDK